jgi:transcription-repair coupling factor (superfamily II helicase)
MDIVIGTHRLLQKDVCFSDIGLIIIDEEHKFGVRHKEKIKQLKKLIDVLTLTATPIPRTLSMAMGGVRCLSVIDTPPPERLPIETYVGEYDDDTVRVAISNEVNRGGQVFYIHDRIDTIDSTVSSLMSMVPGINICYIHGQMPARKIEKIMQDFIAKKYSILVSTTIVESGLDIPSVNTIIISNAQKLGLAQMHQLRGRIGRDKYQAFCYFLYPQEELLTDIARKRLMTIAQHTDLGAGFKIALKDLQIRGAGNLLGSQQHGHIMNVGFDLYCKLLGQAVEEMRCGIDIEEDVETVHTIEINLPVDAYIPVTYISSPVQRIMTYKRLSSASEMKTIEGLAEELVDRYGNMPMQCRILLEIVKIRQLSKQLGVMHISHKAGRVTIRFSNNEILKPEKFSRINMEDNVTIQLEAGKELNIVIDNIFSSGLEDVKKIKNILKVLI